MDGAGRAIQRALSRDVQHQRQKQHGTRSHKPTLRRTEIHFNIRGTLDNGTVIGGRVELEAAAYGDQVDERYMFLEHRDTGRIDVRFAGSCGRPASRPSSTGLHGGRAVVVPIASSPCFVSRAKSRTV